MTITVVYEKQYGLILAAANDDAAKRAMIETNWITGGTFCCLSDDNNWGHLENIYGNKWRESFLAFNRKQLSNMGFNFHTVIVWE